MSLIINMPLPKHTSNVYRFKCKRVCILVSLFSFVGKWNLKSCYAQLYVN